MSNLQEVRARGREVIAIATAGDADIADVADEVIEVPRTDPLLQPILAVVPLQLLAYHVARLRGAGRRPAPQPGEDRHGRMSSAADTADTWNRRRPAKWLKLAGLAVLGLSTVSIPVTIAIALSATGASDALTIAPIAQAKQHMTPAKAVAGLHCVATRGYYALTFDEGPSAGTTPRIVAALSRAKAVATFFDVGEDAVAHQDLVELQRSVGQVANHSYSHPHLSQVSDARREQELTATAKALDFPNVFSARHMAKPTRRRTRRSGARG